MTVLRLRFAGRPPDVSGFVVAVVVDSIKRVRWAGHPANIGKEVVKRRFPSGADANPAPSVAGVVRCSRVIASVSHRLPDTVLAAVAFTVKSICAARQTAAALAFPGDKRLRCDFTLDAAYAAAKIVNANPVAVRYSA